MRRIGLLAMTLASLGACNDVIDLDPIDTTPPVEARVRPKPITGGTLTLVGDQIAVAADPDRDHLYIVDIEAGEIVHDIALDAGDEPSRVVTSDNALAHVVLRGSGGVATVDIESGEVLWRAQVCPDPRGIAYGQARDSLHVACADGALVELDVAFGDALGTTMLETDIRDVFFDGDVLRVSRFRSAEVLRVDDGERTKPSEVDDHAAVSAWRTWYEPKLGGIMVLHQLATTQEVPIEVDPDALDGEGGGGAAYGGGGGDDGVSCEPAISAPALTLLAPDGETSRRVAVPLSVDAAVLSDRRVVLATPGAAPDESSLRITQLDFDDCSPFPVLAALGDSGQFTSVAVTSNDTIVAFSREPARIAVIPNVFGGEQTLIELGGESRFDSGHEIFHRATDSLLSCASCHPEGMDDGHVWKFAELGKRRTQSLEIGIEGTAPFHWDGDFDDLDGLMSEVLAHRMGGLRQSSQRQASFEQWLFAQERPKAAAHRGDPALADAGAVLFADYGCAKCHSGDKLGGANFETFAGQRLQVPSLRRAALRPPFMHDGRAATLEAAVVDMLEGTVQGDVPAADVEAITAYVRTL
jgi:mono/diheme cytochrome c family protein